ncbi:MAG: hypothetical protein AAGK05_15815 [Pseudomonadota bacterium]
MKTDPKERDMIVRSANRGEDWVALSKQLGVQYKTAYAWIRSGKCSGTGRGGKKPKKLTDEMVQKLIEWVESDPQITLKTLRRNILRDYQVSVCVSTIGNCLEGKLYTVKIIHRQPVTVNNAENKAKRAEYVQKLMNYIRQGRQPVWLDETNFNLFTRRNIGRSKKGSRVVVGLPPARGPNVHMIGAIAATGVIKMNTKRGSFTWEAANAWVSDLLDAWSANSKFQKYNLLFINL